MGGKVPQTSYQQSCTSYWIYLLPPCKTARAYITIFFGPKSRFWKSLHRVKEAIKKQLESVFVCYIPPRPYPTSPENRRLRRGYCTRKTPIWHSRCHLLVEVPPGPGIQKNDTPHLPLPPSVPRQLALFIQLLHGNIRNHFLLNLALDKSFAQLLWRLGPFLQKKKKKKKTTPPPPKKKKKNYLAFSRKKEKP